MSEETPEPVPKGEIDRVEESRPDSVNQSATQSPMVIYVLLAAITFFTFWPVVHFDFVNFDDPDYVGNWHVQKGLTLSGIVWAFGTWHPITWISHMLDAQFFGKDPTGPHLVNLLLHVANSVLLFVVLRRMFTVLKDHAGSETQISRIDSNWPSAFVAGVFALHPVQVESVAWVAERKGVLSTFFFMLTLWAYVKYVTKKDVGGGEKSETRNPTSFVKSTTEVRNSETSSKFEFREPKPYYILALIFFALGLLSKPMLVTVPFLLLLLDFWPLGRFNLQPSTCN
jgi:protein O-mannosyl-transferase